MMSLHLPFCCAICPTFAIRHLLNTHFGVAGCASRKVLYHHPQKECIMSKTASLPKYLRVLIIVGIVLGVIGLIIGALCIKVSTFRKDFYGEERQ